MQWTGARKGGFLEPNPAMDIDGWDTAMKTVIQANTYWNAACTLDDVEIQGIRDLTAEDVQQGRPAERGMVHGGPGRPGERKAEIDGKA